MIDINSDNLWETLSELAKNSKSKQAAVAYVTDDSLIAFEDGDLLITDAYEEAIVSGKTSAKVLNNAFQKGAIIYSCDTLHAKSIVFDQHAYIGSANISLNSRKNLDEIGIVSDHPNILSGVVKFVDKLKLISLRVDESYINKILEIKVERQGENKKKRKKINIEHPRYWMISVINDADYPGDEELVDNDNQSIEVPAGEEAAWFWLKKGTKSFNQVKTGDSVVVIAREDKNAEEPDCAYRHITIKHITDDSASEIKAYHYAFSDKYRITWSNFKNIVERAGSRKLGSGLRTDKELNERESNLLFELWNAKQINPADR